MLAGAARGRCCRWCGVRGRYEGVKPATVQERLLNDPLRLRAELMLTVAGQPNLPTVNLLYIRGQWYSGLTDAALNASGSVAANPYAAIGASLNKEAAGSWFYRNIWSPLGSAVTAVGMFALGILDGATFGLASVTGGLRCRENNAAPPRLKGTRRGGGARGNGRSPNDAVEGEGM